MGYLNRGGVFAEVVLARCEAVEIWRGKEGEEKSEINKEMRREEKIDG